MPSGIVICRIASSRMRQNHRGMMRRRKWIREIGGLWEKELQLKNLKSAFIK